MLISRYAPTGGTVKLASANPYAAPLIDPAFLTHEFDTFAMVQAMNDVQQIVMSPTWKGYVTGALGGLANAVTNDLKLAYARANSFNVNHCVGTAHMSPVGATTGVVNPDMTVKKTSKLRIVDASVFVSTIGSVYRSLFTLLCFSADHSTKPSSSARLHDRRTSCRPHQSRSQPLVIISCFHASVL